MTGSISAIGAGILASSFGTGKQLKQPEPRFLQKPHGSQSSGQVALHATEGAVVPS